MHPKQTTQSKHPEIKVSSVNGQQKTKDFFSSPTLRLAAFQYSYVKGEENHHSIQNRVAGKIPGKDAVTDHFPGTVGCAQRAGFNYTNNSSSATVKIHCHAGNKCVIPATELSSQTLICKHVN